MITAPLVALLALGLQGQTPQTAKPDTSSYTDVYLGLSFDIPKTWTIVKKTKDMTRYAIPVEGSAMPAELEIIRSPFHSTKDIWQTIQLRTNETLHREVARQWEQDVIQVPILFTQINWSDKGVPKTTLTGLYYTRTPLKMLLRLTTGAADFEKVRYDFQQALETLHTTNGTQPQEDNEDVKFEPTKKPQPVPDRPKVISGAPKAAKVVKPPVSVPMTVSTKPVTLRLPQGWTASDPADGKLTIKNSRLSVPLALEVRLVLDSEPGISALLRQTGLMLDQFLPGLTRLDTEPKSNEAGCTVSTVWRLGRSKDGDLYTFDALGQQGDFYLLASYRSTSKASVKNDQKLLKELFEEISLETPQP